VGDVQRLAFGENQRFLQVVKMRGTNHSRDEHPFAIAFTISARWRRPDRIPHRRAAAPDASDPPTRPTVAAALALGGSSRRHRLDLSICPAARLRSSR